MKDSPNIHSDCRFRSLALSGRVLCCLVLLLCAALHFPVFAEDAPMRGVWVSTVYDLDYPSSPGLSAAQLKDEANTILQNAKKWGLNTVFLQVRPCGDAFYRSDRQPWSQWLTGKQGQAPADGFDPLAYWVESCHSAGLALHAWINPYRLTRKAASTREEAFSQLCKDHPARAIPDCVIFHSDGCLYYDPGRPEVREELLACVRELLERYDIDGIHLDDYFYPGRDFEDAETFSQLGSDFADIGDFRRDAVNQLVSALHELTKKTRPEAVFGISPAGIWAVSSAHPLGAQTKGSQSYFDHYADSRKWVREAMVDYIMPQIYWPIGAEAGDFSVLLDWWSRTVQDTDVRLYIGLAAYQSVNAAADSPWFGSQELIRQLELIRQSETVSGAVFFRYRSILDAALADCIAEAFAPKADQAPAPVYHRAKTILPLSPSRPLTLLSGEKISICCRGPRAARITAFCVEQWCRLKSDCRGGFSGFLPVNAAVTQPVRTAPVLLCAEHRGCLTVRLMPTTVTAICPEREASVRDVRWDGEHLLLSTDAPCAADASVSGDLLQLTLRPCAGVPEYTDPFFSSVRVQKEGEAVIWSFALPSDGTAWCSDLCWSPGQITVTLQKNQPDD